ncbi:helix-turn-helix transcriptional regulator [Salinibacterium sp. NK8237]|uniref:ArsR/SmtB family transcription factor n=1 Tax=Salinibacterium sp. NK8237 TaxID=2792038 RepID=UPI0018CD6D97|nr:metalloregulator ArsR/SmtB family transcription factor [Salinibacterium sp. NK8237]MBH0130818.1 winged helix-turn-helix transcriptional regulator [Salinibacterium sp. NK8237]
MADIFDVVADSTRRSLLTVLLEQYIASDSPSGELSVSEIVEKLDLSQPTVSKHLKVLRDHGLVSVREDGQHRYYRLDSSPLEEVEDWLIPFLSADFQEDFDEELLESTGAFSAWSGADVGDNLGRQVADRAYQARTALHDVAEAAKHFPGTVRSRIFRKE